MNELFDTFVCNVGALLKKQKHTQEGPEFQAVIDFLNTHGYSCIAADLSVLPPVPAV